MNELLSKILHFIMSILIEADPYFDSEMEFKWCIESRRYESDAVYLLAFGISFSQKVKDEPFVDLFMIFMFAIDLKNKTASLTIFRVLPSW